MNNINQKSKLSRLQEVDLVFSHFYPHFYSLFFLIYFPLFLFLELRVGVSDKIMQSHNRPHQMTQSQVT